MQLTNIQLNEVRHSLENLILIVGPNGSGKTTLLYDMFTQAIHHTSHLTTSGRTLRWHDEMFRDNFYSLSRDDFSRWLDEQQIIIGSTVNGEQQYTSQYALAQSQGFTLSESNLSQIRALINDVQYDLEGDGTYAPKIKGTYFTHYPVDGRFRLAQDSIFGFAERKAASLFFHNDRLLSQVNRYLSVYFDKKIFVEYSSDTQYQLLIGSSSIQPPKIYRHDSKGIARTLKEHREWRQLHSNVQPLNEEGHGIRAFIEIITGLVDDYQKVVFIDEPELHLYPDVKRRLGADIARISRRKQTFIVTHDMDIIDGIVNAETPFNILRVTPRKTLDIFKFGLRELRRLHAEKKSPDALKVGFYDCAVFVEGVGERYVYGGAISSKHLLDDYSYTMVACHGKDRVANHMKFALSLNLPSVIVMDYDAIYNKKDALVRVLETFLEYPQFRDQESLIEALIQDVEEIKNLTQGVADKTKGLGGDTTRYSNDTHNKIYRLLEQLKEVGIFLVPIGELEDWVGAAKQTVPEVVLARYLSRSNSKYRDLTGFLQEVTVYLRRAIRA